MPLTSPARCTCGEFRTSRSGRTTGCNRTTVSRFAPGHDAKLKAFLIRSGADGEHVICRVGPLAGQSLTALEHATALGYGEQVAEAIDNEVARRAARSLSDLGNARG